MQLFLFLFFILALCTKLFSQPKEFEGVIVYKTDLQSKLDGVSAETLFAVLGAADTVETYIKQGNYYRKSSVSEHYYLRKDEKLYIRYNGIDTLYFIPYSQDTSAVLGITDLNSRKTVVGYDCKAVNIRTAHTSTTFYYAPQLKADPEYTKSLTLGQLNHFVEKTNAVWLANVQEGLSYTMVQSGLRVEPKTLDDDVFTLPSLPVKKLQQNQLAKAPEFSGVEKSWAEFIGKYIHAELGAKYLKFKKGEDVVRQVVYVGFVVTPDGDVINTKVLNPKQVHPKLAEEAMEVIKLSGWKPGTVGGKPVNYPLVQPIVFEVWNN